MEGRICIICNGQDEGEEADWQLVATQCGEDQLWAHWDCLEKKHDDERAHQAAERGWY